MATEPTTHINENELTVKELILNIQGWVRYLWSKWRVLLLVSILGGIVGLAYAWLKKPQYIATTTFVLESNDSRSGLSRLSSVAAVAGLDLGNTGGGLFQGNNIVELYKSRKMLEQTLLAKINPVSDELLIDRYITINDIKDDWKDRPELLSLNFSQAPETLDSLSRRLRDGVISSFANAIRSDLLLIENVDKNLSILKVVVTSNDEEFSKVFNETLVKKVSEFYIQTKTQKSTDNIAILESKVDSVRAVMTGAIYSVNRVSDATPNLNPTRQTQRNAPAQEAQFLAETNKNMLAQLLQNLELTKMNLLQEQPLIQLIDQPVYPLKIERVGKVKGLVVGGFLFGFLSVIVIICHKYYRDVMAEN